MYKKSSKKQKNESEMAESEINNSDTENTVLDDTTKDSAANTENVSGVTVETPKKKHGGKPFKKGSGENRDPRILYPPVKRPKDEFTWKNVKKNISEMYAEDIIKIVGEDSPLGQLFASFPQNIQLKYLINFSAFGEYVKNPGNARLYNAIADGLSNFEENSNDSKHQSISIPAELIAPSFFEVYRALISKAFTEFVLYGGRGSTKSSFISLAIIYLIVNNPTYHAVVMRQVADTLRTSCFAQLQWAIDQLGLTDKFKSTTSPMEMTYIPTGQKILFRGADDVSKLKSLKMPFGTLSVLWFEEATEFRGESALRSITQSVIRGTNTAYIWISYNPPRAKNNWINKYVAKFKERQFKHKSCYLDVPKEWLGKVFLDEAEHLKNINPSAYEHEYLGESVGLGDQAFDHVILRKITDEEIKTFDNTLHGLDFGFFPHPAHYAQVYYDPTRSKLYIFGEVRKWKFSNKEMYDAIKEYGYKDDQLLLADSAEPKSVADYRSYGATCRGAEKGPESLKYSMKWLQSIGEIIIDPERAPYAAEEFVDFAYEKTKDGEILESFPNEKDDAIAATRYATNLIWKRRGQ